MKWYLYPEKKRSLYKAPKLGHKLNHMGVPAQVNMRLLSPTWVPLEGDASGKATPGTTDLKLCTTEVSFWVPTGCFLYR